MTCLESLAASLDRKQAEEARESLLRFAKHALKRPDCWSSDNGGFVYCRVRALGSILRTHPSLINELDEEQSENLLKLLRQAWRPSGERASFGLSERTSDPYGEQQAGDSAGQGGYPPNAFLTYWGLIALEHLSPDLRGDLRDACHEPAVDWLEKTLTVQVAYHYQGSVYADPQQLAWALCGLVRFAKGDGLRRRSSPKHELMNSAVRAFFEQQHRTRRDWDRGKQLFHYPNVGNAYCYTYETLGELLSLAISTSEWPGRALMDALHPYQNELVATYEAIWNAALRDGGQYSWSSGHHLNNDAPEPWATASVFRFVQSLRRLVATWTSEEARNVLGARKPQVDERLLAERGGSWNTGWGSAGAQLACIFVHPVKRKERDLRKDDRGSDPDAELLGSSSARSAILYGPPGTGKTNLVEAVAGAIGWDFVEISPAQFLDHGVEMVSARADEIFRAVMELDRCVVLLDEIDELIQVRDEASEPIERFFTTTMLPRLARLWKKGRVLFFVNTNGIEKVDPAIKRSQRFDAAILVMPPGAAVKSRRLSDATGQAVALDEDVITGLLTDRTPPTRDDGRASPAPRLAGRRRRASNPDRAATPPESADYRSLGWLPLIRHDQLTRLCDDYGSNGGNWPAGFSEVVRPFAEELARSDWADVVCSVEETRFDGIAHLLSFQRRDHDRELLASVQPELSLPDGLDGRDGYLQIPAGEANLDRWAASVGLLLAADGTLSGR